MGVVVAGAFLALLNQTVMSPALPGLMQTFGVGAGDAQWVTSIYMLVNGIMVPISGYLIDKFSTRKLFFASLSVFVAGTVLCAVAPSFGVLLAGRVLQAAGAGVQLPLVAVVPMLVFPPEKRGTAMGMAGIVMSAGPAVGPVAGGAIIDAFGWRLMFWAIVPLALIIAVASWFLLDNVASSRILASTCLLFFCPRSRSEACCTVFRVRRVWGGAARSSWPPSRWARLPSWRSFGASAGFRSLCCASAP